MLVSANDLRAPSMLAMLLNTFQVDLKPGDPPPFPDVRDFAELSDPRS